MLVYHVVPSCKLIAKAGYTFCVLKLVLFFERSYLITGLWLLNRNHHMRGSTLLDICVIKCDLLFKYAHKNKTKVITPLDNGKEVYWKNLSVLKWYVCASCNIFAWNDVAKILELVQTNDFYCKIFWKGLQYIWFFCLYIFHFLYTSVFWNVTFALVWNFD